MIKQEKIIEIRDRASIVEVISDYVTLRRVGRNFTGLCPFHAEKSPSFTVSEEKAIFHCFGCRAGGSVFQFLMQYDHLTFPEAVERVASRYGIEVERQSAKNGEVGERESLYRINERAAANYHKILFGHPAGRRALDYLKSRKVNEELARRFLVGYAPPTGSGLLDVLRKEQLPVKDALRLGLIGQRSEQQFHEKFFGRLMFPIINAGGKVVGFGGRVLDGGLPKYINSSESPLFRKGSTLYGLYQAKEGIRRADRVVVVEGYLDVIALHQFGLSSAVATLGTALTPDHVRLLGRYTQNIVALFDGDDAGRKAAARSFEIFVETGLLGRAAFLPAGEDPDTYVHRHGPDALEKILEQAIPLADYYFSWLKQRFGMSLEGKSQIANEVSRLLAKLSNPFEVDLLVQRAVDTLGIREELLRRSAPPSGYRPGAKTTVQASSEKTPPSRDDIAEQSLVSLMLRGSNALRSVEKEREVRQWLSPKWRDIVDLILAEWQEQGKVDVFRVAQKVDPDSAGQITALALQGESIPEIECDRMAADCFSHLRRKYLRTLERNLRVAIRAAEEQKDEQAKRERILEWQDVVRKGRQLERQRLELKRTSR
ncbi:MAG TPA: DNA primase [Candidatus Binatia bacterium]|nr:DNA primase [Candidatus Binatia bacterium]